MGGKTNIFIHINNLICMETKKYYGVKGDKEFPSYMSEFFQAWPEKFEERKNMVKPAFYGLLAVVCVFIVIFPQVIPLLPLWLIRVAGVIGVLFFGIGAWMASSDTYNVESGGKVKAPRSHPQEKHPRAAAANGVQVASDGRARYGAGLFLKAQRAQFYALKFRWHREVPSP